MPSVLVSPSKPRATPAVAGVLDWLDDPAADRGIFFASDGDDWDYWTYDRLAQLTRRVAAGLRQAGVGDHDVVAIVQRCGPEFVASLFGTMLAGAAASPIAAPMPFQHPTGYAGHLVGLLAGARPAIVLTETGQSDQVRTASRAAAPDGSSVQVTTVAEIADDTLSGRPDEATKPDRTDRLALLQFTSGSSGRARAVRVPHAALSANVAAIRQWLRWTPDDPVASWLPVHHDMGLTGCLVTPVVSQSNVWLMAPEQFVRRPERYLRCFGELGARFTAMPNFGLDHIARRVEPEQLRGMDFTEWRAAIIGAEHLAADAFQRCYDLLHPYGLRRAALLPAYGLATLAVTGLPLDEGWCSVSIEPASLTLGQPVVRLDEQPASEGDQRPGEHVVGCGRPLAGLSVAVYDEAGRPCLDGYVGEILVRGSSVAGGYADDQMAGSSTFVDGELHTGDAGFMLDGQLFVLGRLGDSLKIRGRSVFAEDLEAIVQSVGVPAHRLAVALGLHRGFPTAVVVLEVSQQSWLTAARRKVAQRVEQAKVVVLDMPRGTIPRTSSGKVRRREIWRAFCAGELPVT